jgi:hypothetical protein
MLFFPCRNSHVAKCSQPFGWAILWLYGMRLLRMRISGGPSQKQIGEDIIDQTAARLYGGCHISKKLLEKVP